MAAEVGNTGAGAPDNVTQVTGPKGRTLRNAAVETGVPMLPDNMGKPAQQYIVMDGELVGQPLTTDSTASAEPTDRMMYDSPVEGQGRDALFRIYQVPQEGIVERNGRRVPARKERLSTGEIVYVHPGIFFDEGTGPVDNPNAHPSSGEPQSESGTLNRATEGAVKSFGAATEGAVTGGDPKRDALFYRHQVPKEGFVDDKGTLRQGRKVTLSDGKTVIRVHPDVIF